MQIFYPYGLLTSRSPPKKLFKIGYDGKTIKNSRVTHENTKRS